MKRFSNSHSRHRWFNLPLQSHLILVLVLTVVGRFGRVVRREDGDGVDEETHAVERDAETALFETERGEANLSDFSQILHGEPARRSLREDSVDWMREEADARELRISRVWRRRMRGFCENLGNENRYSFRDNILNSGKESFNLSLSLSHCVIDFYY
ncbi:uncharacterized protein G2W53_021422 [Senna tora]|uniref:Uncharacterized protein n=1 Tax=Senna tora TaxID=362788 RepID=A0A834WJK1_9FABA|nr:uncharacterized protein G2W53_021422 [Senna tora]